MTNAFRQNGLGERVVMLATARRLISPFLVAAKRGDLILQMSVETHPDSGPHSSSSARLQGLARVLCGIAPMIEAGTLPEGPWQALLGAAVDPHHPGFLGGVPGRQTLVEAAFLALAIRRAPTALWDSLSEPVQSDLVTFLRSTRQISPDDTNWLLFPAMIEVILHLIDKPWQRAPVAHAVAMFQHWYRGDGLYGDGPVVHMDYYNSYVIHPMLLDITFTFADVLPRFTAIARQTLIRAQRHAEVLERLIAPDGSFPPLGRSLAYRCGAFHLLAELALTGRLPSSLPPAQVRGALAAVVARTLDTDHAYTPEGWLRIGLNGPQPALAERYINTGSLYLCSTALLPLGLPETHPFWSAPPAPFTQARLWTMGADIPLDTALAEC